jgi:hypothetical protein
MVTIVQSASKKIPLTHLDMAIQIEAEDLRSGCVQVT